MSESISGVVEKIYDDKTDRYSKRTFVVNGGRYGGFINKGNEKEVMGIREGDSVVIEFTRNGKFCNFTDVQLVKGGTTKEVAAPAYGTAVNSYTVDKDLRITYLASRKDALAFLDILARAGKLDKQLAKGVDALDSLVDGVTATFVTKALAVRADQFVEKEAKEAEESEGNE